MKKASKYLFAVAVPFLLINICWSIVDIQYYSNHEPSGRWQGYHPKLWPYLIVNTLVLGVVLYLAVKKLGSVVLVPLVYGLAAGLYFYLLRTRLHGFGELEDTFLVRPLWSLIGLIPMVARDIFMVVVEAFKAERRAKMRRRRSG